MVSFRDGRVPTVSVSPVQTPCHPRRHGMPGPGGILWRVLSRDCGGRRREATMEADRSRVRPTTSTGKSYLPAIEKLWWATGGGDWGERRDAGVGRGQRQHFLPFASS